MNIAAIIMAAGKGERMKARLHKVLHKVGGKPLVWYGLENIKNAGISNVNVVVGSQANQIKKALGDDVNFIKSEPKGTGWAVKVALPEIDHKFSTILVINGDDAVFYKTQTIKELIQKHLDSKAKMTVLTSIQENTSISGRVIRDKKGRFLSIKANSKLSEEELKSNKEIICGIYLFEREWLERELSELLPSKISGEYLLTSLIFSAIEQNSLLDVKLRDSNEWRSVNNKQELLEARKLWRQIHG